MSLRNQVMDILVEIKSPNLYIPEILVMKMNGHSLIAQTEILMKPLKVIYLPLFKLTEGK